MEEHEHRRRNRKRIIGIANLAVVFILIGGLIIWGSMHNEIGQTVEDASLDGNNTQAAGKEGGRKGQKAGGRRSAAIPTGEQLAEAAVTKNDLMQTYDTVIKGGRVINPETKLDAMMNVGIIGDKIGVVTAKPLTGKLTIDASGLIVAPGFIDNLSYDPNPLGVWNKIADGVTSNIAMHGGTSTPDKWYDYYGRNETPVHYGASFFYSQARNQFQLGRYDRASADQIAKLKEQAEKALNDGALGISFSLEYVPGIQAAEIIPLMELAHEYNVPVYFHARYSDMEEPGTNIDGLNELIGYARQTEAAVHIDHINSTGGTFSMTQSLALVEKARAEGLDITACIYPYDYWGTYLNSARFDEGWQSRFHITYNDLQLAGSTERLTKETFMQYQREGKLAVAYAIPPEDIEESIKPSYVMIGSDAILEPGLNNHPRASGTFARTIGLYARERGVITLMEAIEKTSLLPAQRLEREAPLLKKKGRVAKGMDADLVVFDYKTIIDESTVEHPELYSSGIKYVWVGGQTALSNGKLNHSIHVGQPIKSQFQRVDGTMGGQLDWNGKQYPLLSYNGLQYVDLYAASDQGYEMQWDKVNHQFTIVRNQKRSDGSSTYNEAMAKSASEPPVTGTLMLERGYEATMNGAKVELLSVGDRAYAPIDSFMKLIGTNVTNNGITWTVS
ncbi:dihydroorotase-like cyclic amidohydrolase [Paenibacillus cellulosilyticus]|uniref:Dihydroorotase-like cyclic amidohydrolase n=1 Tax=Paenibacillus cellulosilyticus TaxID=375489 RepID=A0A2V2Z1U7_9BACL|nr:amidohydrolase family protein [Paenibacillus cellulosilyticus]PWW08822.1 dihydroorotase-like cyclic amidohydrolase [Paenibacillus cellulosilyticus]QKS48373.1 amidohydrolase family protein [Paenibacillus cellulosilyticus]